MRQLHVSAWVISLFNNDKALHFGRCLSQNHIDNVREGKKADRYIRSPYLLDLNIRGED